MDKSTAIGIFNWFGILYGLILLIALLGGGIELALVPPLFKSPFFLPKEALYGFPVIFIAFSFLISKRKDDWFLILIAVAVAILEAARSQDIIGYAVSFLLIVIVVHDVLRETGILKRDDD